VRDICAEHDGVAERTQIYNLALQGDISEIQVNDVISKMLTSGELWSPRADQFSFVR